MMNPRAKDFIKSAPRLAWQTVFHESWGYTHKVPVIQILHRLDLPTRKRLRGLASLRRPTTESTAKDFFLGQWKRLTWKDDPIGVKASRGYSGPDLAAIVQHSSLDIFPNKQDVFYIHAIRGIPGSALPNIGYPTLEAAKRDAERLWFKQVLYAMGQQRYRQAFQQEGTAKDFILGVGREKLTIRHPPGWEGAANYAFRDVWATIQGQNTFLGVLHCVDDPENWLDTCPPGWWRIIKTTGWANRHVPEAWPSAWEAAEALLALHMGRPLPKPSRPPAQEGLAKDFIMNLSSEQRLEWRDGPRVDLGYDNNAGWVVSVKHIGSQFVVTHVKGFDDPVTRQWPRACKTREAAKKYGERLWFRYGKPIWRENLV